MDDRPLLTHIVINSILELCPVSISSVAVGTTFGWPSSQAAFLSSPGPDNPIGRPISTSELSWVGSLVAIGALLAPFAAGFTADRIGRKYALLSSAAFFILSYILLGTAAALWQVLVARLLQVIRNSCEYFKLPSFPVKLSRDWE